ncbi:hypothetical protein [Marisediminitalea sp.]|uniref:hypothetical protein n=1 Tax=Marisediminitalea sp. TaxID=2662268 RepID=UPI00351172E1
MVVAGIDPSLSNFGLAKGVVYSNALILTDIQLVTSESDKKNKKYVRKNSDDLNRAKQLIEGTRAFISDADLIMVEVPIGSQSARAMASYGICIGILAGLDKPMIQVTPEEVKVAATRKKTATKQDMIDWALQQYPQLPWLTRKRKGFMEYIAKNEHLADAIGAIHAGIQCETFKQLVALNQGLKEYQP